MQSTTTTSQASSHALSTSEWLTLLTLCAAQFLVALDFSIVTVALPSIGRDLTFANSEDLQWVMTACILPTATLLLLFGRVSDLYGRRRLLVTGLTLITAFSVIAAWAQESWVLIAARAGQGFGAAMVGPAALGLLTATFPEGPRRDKALGVSGALLSAGFIVGTIGGGLITANLTWRWTMVLLTIMGALILFGAIRLRRDTAIGNDRLDVKGAILATAGLVAIVYGISSAAQAGWASVQTIATLVAGIVLLAGFLRVEATHPSPLAPLDILRRRTVKWGGFAGFITFGMTGGVTVLLSLYMQNVLGWSPTDTGFGLLGEGISAIVAGAIAARVITKLGIHKTLVIGLVVQAAGIAGMALLPAHTSLVLLLVTTSALGLGHVSAVVAFIGIMTSGVPDSSQGLAGGLAQTAQQIGSAVGVAGLSAVAVARTFPSHSTQPAALLGGIHSAMVAAAIAVIVAAIASSLFLRPSNSTGRA